MHIVSFCGREITIIPIHNQYTYIIYFKYFFIDLFLRYCISTKNWASLSREFVKVKYLMQVFLQFDPSTLKISQSILSSIPSCISE